MTTVLPHGWVVTNLGQIGQYLNGRAFKSTDWSDSGRPIIRIQNLTGSGSSFNHYQGRVEERYLVRDGDLLVSWAATLGVFVWNGPEAVLNQHIFKVKSFIDQGFHRYLAEHLLSTLMSNAHGSGMVHITKKRFQTTPILLPPLPEQKRIVERIEGIFSRLNRVEFTLTSLLDKLRNLRSAVLSDAFHADSDVPAGWRQTSIGKIAEVQLGRQRSPRHHVGKQMRPYLRAGNVTWSGLSLNDIREMNFDDNDFEKYKLKPGDILLNESSGSPNEVGKPAIWNGAIEECCFQNTLLRLRPRSVDLGYLFWYCYFSAWTGRFGEASRGVNIRHLGKRGLVEFPIAVAPRAEQRQIVDQIEGQLEHVAGLEDAVQSGLDRMAAIRQTVLGEAFAGRLVVQNSNDEPASALLERIGESKPAMTAERKASV